VDDATSTVVHEDAHQWTGDLVRLARWQDIWLNEGFATYAEWLWSGHEGGRTPQERFKLYASAIPPDDPFWSVAIGDPGPDSLFDGSVYLRGAMTLQALRTRIGDHAFFRLLRLWPKRYGGQAVTTDDFVALAERVSHQQLDDLFDEWLYTPGRPASLPAASRAGSAAASVERSPAPFWRSAPKR
jgi:aminopeptidase N